MIRLRAFLPAMCLLVDGCAGAPPVATPMTVAVPRIDSAIGRPCAARSDLPDFATPAEVRHIIATDRAHLADCAARQHAMAELYDRVRRDLGSTQ